MKARPALMIVLVLVACGGGAPSTVAPTSPSAPGPTFTQPGATASASQPVAEVVMCSLMPLADVQAASPFSTPLADSAQGATPGMCEYISAQDADEPVGVLLAATDFGSTELAQAHMVAYRQNITAAGVTLSEVAGVGDEAVSSGSDEVGVHAIVRNFAVDANLGGEWPDTPDSAKAAAGTSLLQTMISRLP